MCTCQTTGVWRTNTTTRGRGTAKKECKMGLTRVFYDYGGGGDPEINFGKRVNVIVAPEVRQQKHVPLPRRNCLSMVHGVGDSQAGTYGVIQNGAQDKYLRRQQLTNFRPILHHHRSQNSLGIPGAGRYFRIEATVKDPHDKSSDLITTNTFSTTF